MTEAIANFESVPFHERYIQVTTDEPHYVALKPLFEGMGMEKEWSGIQKQINADEVLMECMKKIPHLAKDGKMREMVCLPMDMLNGLLFKINAHPYKTKNPELYAVICEYQRKCYKVLKDYFALVWEKPEDVTIVKMHWRKKPCKKTA